jgi:hypothetical protein
MTASTSKGFSKKSRAPRRRTSSAARVPRCTPDDDGGDAGARERFDELAAADVRQRQIEDGGVRGPCGDGRERGAPALHARDLGPEPGRRTRDHGGELAILGDEQEPLVGGAGHGREAI